MEYQRIELALTFFLIVLIRQRKHSLYLARIPQGPAVLLNAWKSLLPEIQHPLLSSSCSQGMVHPRTSELLPILWGLARCMRWPSPFFSSLLLGNSCLCSCFHRSHLILSILVFAWWPSLSRNSYILSRAAGCPVRKRNRKYYIICRIARLSSQNEESTRSSRNFASFGRVLVPVTDDQIHHVSNLITIFSVVAGVSKIKGFLIRVWKNTFCNKLQSTKHVSDSVSVFVDLIIIVIKLFERNLFTHILCLHIFIMHAFI